ncbi:MAG: hypothetical protein ABSA64_06230 [Sedimentisphaerales bacterium]
MAEEEVLLYIYSPFTNRKSVFFIENILPKSFLNEIGFVFNCFMRSYAYVFIPFVLICFIVNEFVSNILIFIFILLYCYFHFAILIIAYYFHCRFRDYIDFDLNKLLMVNMTNNVDEHQDIVSLITLRHCRIPPEIITCYSYADRILKEIQQIPFLHNLTRTIVDHKYLRFSWIKADKSKQKEFISALKVGDIILYHSCKSVIGSIIRFLSRCYWEHSDHYIGNGKVMNVAPGGIKAVDINKWVTDDKVELAVLRRQDMDIEYFNKFMQKIEGGKYNYLGVLIELWRIITNKKQDGLMTLPIFIINITLVFIIMYVWYRHPDLTRLHLFLFLIFAPYLFDTVYHWWVYKKDFSELDNFRFLKGSNK